jgi:hypothetical protein
MPANRKIPASLFQNVSRKKQETKKRKRPFVNASKRISACSPPVNGDRQQSSRNERTANVASRCIDEGADDQKADGQSSEA